MEATISTEQLKDKLDRKESGAGDFVDLGQIVFTTQAGALFS
jgi:hypothetical protein